MIMDESRDILSAEDNGAGMEGNVPIVSFAMPEESRVDRPGKRLARCRKKRITGRGTKRILQARIPGIDG